MSVEREKTYTHGHAPSVLRSHLNRTVANSAAYLADRLVPGAAVLDVGCGPGTISIDIARRVAPGRVLAIDAAEAPLAGARERAAQAGIDTITFEVGDAYALDLPDDSFDVVHAHQVLQHLGDPVAALREMLRVCRPDGVVGVRDADYAAMTWYPADPLLDRWLAIYRAVARGNGAQPDAGRHLLAWARAAGAASVVPSASVWCYATPEEREWWGGMWADRIVESDLTRQAIDGGHADLAELRAISAAWRAWAVHPDGWFAILHGEVLAAPAR
ncbi:Methyltransferase domain-containing protein [Pseudonocardia thermophila]|uniref:Methyltransferase domain-containing protein n=1 Tax=Pseudonocardia thermophila TaxID=1848 RepID=A0A1M6N4J5_PSETH|nr:methyltransferase domain-containing protein [Pseudonocardia thermophila]SHJ90625.1 Methyltransferase domain-containing protein [Pseudonocardia thermophila]